MHPTINQQSIQLAIDPAVYSAPAVITLASDIGAPVDIFNRLSQDAKHAFLLESTEGDDRLARYSFAGCDPILTVTFRNGDALINYRDSDETIKQSITDPLQFLQDLCSQFLSKLTQATKDATAREVHARETFAKLCSDLPFAGGLVGYMGYNACRYFDKIPQQIKDPLSVAEAYYGLYDSIVAFDHQYRRVHILSFRGLKHAESILSKILQNERLKPLLVSNVSLKEEEIFEQAQTSFSKEEYTQGLLHAKEFIKQGEAFQIAFSQRFSIPCLANTIDVYRMLQATNPSPYAYYLKTPDFVYLGSSPETFLQCRNGKLMLRAIAGTRRRGIDANEDTILSKELKNDEKEMAEHRMLVDLGRNDLGRICKPGTVRPDELAVITKYTHVMHMATAIRGELLANKTSFDAFKSCFPAGTVSGAPKIRAMQLLCQLEPERRGIYSGAVGYFDFSGNMDAAIAIRSTLIKDGVAHVQAGGGIVFDSQPEAEYQESRNKAKSVLQAVKLANKATRYIEA